MREIVVYVIAIIALLGFVVIVNNYTNNIKKESCNKLGGEFIYNSTDANLSMCKFGVK